MSNDCSDDIMSTVFEFIKDLKDNVFVGPIEQGELVLVEFWFKKLKSKQIADHVVKHILPHEDKIKKKDLKFFLQEKNSIFGGLPNDRVDYYTNLIVTPEAQGGISEENKGYAWSYFNTLVELCKKYKKNK